MSKLQAILAAAGVTSVVVIAILAMNMPPIFNRDQAEPVVEAEEPVDTAAAAQDEEYINALGERLDQLDEARTVMDDRQDTYLTQIDAAEQTVTDLQAMLDEMQAQITANQEALVTMETEYNNASGYSWQLKQQRDALAAQEAEYAAQIEAANQTILALQAQIQQMTGQ
jgi:chromosome segregation ATPase